MKLRLIQAVKVLLICVVSVVSGIRKAKVGLSFYRVNGGMLRKKYSSGCPDKPFCGPLPTVAKPRNHSGQYLVHGVHERLRAADAEHTGSNTLGPATRRY